MRTNADRMKARTILWRRLDAPGHDSCRVRAQADGYEVIGTALFLAGNEPCRFDYRVCTDGAWRTVHAEVVGWHGEEEVGLRIDVSSERRWECNGKELSQVQGCLDVDFAFSPATNTLPIKRLGLSVGESANVSAAWLAFPGLNISRLDQVYTRSELRRYSYAAPSLGFSADLRVSEFGLVMQYPGLWELETSKEGVVADTPAFLPLEGRGHGA